MPLDQSKSNVRYLSLSLSFASYFLKVTVTARSINITIYNVIVDLLRLLCQVNGTGIWRGVENGRTLKGRQLVYLEMQKHLV